MTQKIENPNVNNKLSEKNVFFVVFITAFLDMIGFGLIIPILPFYVRELGGTDQTAGFLVTTFSFFQFIATPFLGKLSDKYGRRPIILLSLIGNAIAMFIYATAPSIAFLFLARAIGGATAGNLAACQACVADVSTQENRAKGMGQVGAGIGLGMILGPFIGGMLSHYSLGFPGYFAAVFAVLDAILVYFILPETNKNISKQKSPEFQSATENTNEQTTQNSLEKDVKRSSFKEMLLDIPLLKVFVLFFLSGMAMSSLILGMPIHLRSHFGFDERKVGYAFGIFGLCGVVVQGFLMGRLTRRFGELNVAKIGVFSMGAGMVLLSISKTIPQLTISSFLTAIGTVVVMPSISTIISRVAKKEDQGAALGIGHSWGGLSRTIGPTFAGYLAQNINTAAPFLNAAVNCFLFLIIAMTITLPKNTPEHISEHIEKV